MHFDPSYELTPSPRRVGAKHGTDMAHVLCNCEGCSQLLAGNQSRRMESSPPRKRARTLKIAHVSCLVASQQRTAFRSPEKPVSTASSRSTDTPLDTTVVEETPHSLEDLFSQELIEEDTVIQSSLPRYLSHVYGSSTNQPCSYIASLTAAKSCGVAGTTATLAGTTANRTAELCSPAIAESQGFTVTGDSSAVLATVNERAGEKGESPLVATMLSRDNTPDDPTEVERVKQLGGQVKVGRKGVLRVVWDVSLRTASSSDTLSSVKSENSVGTEISPPLFDSPDSPSPTHANHPPASPLTTSGLATVDSSKTLHEVSLAHTVLLNHGETNKPDSLLPVPAKEKTTGGVELILNRTSKKRRSRAVVEKAQYMCPPLCVSLARCTAMRPDSLVSVLAIVLQGSVCVCVCVCVDARSLCVFLLQLMLLWKWPARKAHL